MDGPRGERRRRADARGQSPRLADREAVLSRSLSIFHANCLASRLSETASIRRGGAENGSLILEPFVLSGRLAFLDWEAGAGLGLKTESLRERGTYQNVGTQSFDNQVDSWRVGTPIAGSLGARLGPLSLGLDLDVWPACLYVLDQTQISSLIAPTGTLSSICFVGPELGLDFRISAFSWFWAGAHYEFLWLSVPRLSQNEAGDAWTTVIDGGASSGSGGVLDPMLAIFEDELGASYDASRSLSGIFPRGLAGSTNSIMHGLPSTTAAKVRAKVRETIAASGLEKSRDLAKVAPALATATAAALKDPAVVGDTPLAETELVQVNAVASRAVAKSLNAQSVTALAEGLGTESEKKAQLEALTGAATANVNALGISTTNLGDALQKVVLVVVDAGNADLDPAGTGASAPETLLANRMNSLVKIAAAKLDGKLTSTACATALNDLANAAVVGLGSTALAASGVDSTGAKLQTVGQDGVLAGLFLAYCQYTQDVGLGASALRSAINFADAVSVIGTGAYADKVSANVQAARDTIVPAAGTLDAPVVFTRAYAGAWGSIVVNSGGNSFAYCDIGGGVDGIKLNGRAAISRCVFHENSSNGLDAQSATYDILETTTVSDCHFYGNGDAAAAINQYVAFGTSNHFYNPQTESAPDATKPTNRVFFAGNVDGNVAWGVTEVPYHVTGTPLNVNSPGCLTIKPGVIVKFAQGAYARVWNGAQLRADGTAAAPIVFTSINDSSVGGATTSVSPSPGDWGSIDVMAAACSFSHCRFSYGDIALLFNDYYDRVGYATVDSCSFHHNLRQGINGWRAKAGTTVTNSYFWSNASWPVAINENVDLDASNHFYDPAIASAPDLSAGFNAIYLCGDVSANLELVVAEIPYYVPSDTCLYVYDAARLYIGPGAIVKFANSGYLRVNMGASSWPRARPRRP